MKTPFAWIDGQPWLITSFDLDPAASGMLSLRDMLEHLLENYAGSELIILRRLTEEETQILVDGIEERDVEAWAHISALAKKREG